MNPSIVVRRNQSPESSDPIKIYGSAESFTIVNSAENPIRVTISVGGVRLAEIRLIKGSTTNVSLYYYEGNLFASAEHDGREVSTKMLNGGSEIELFIRYTQRSEIKRKSFWISSSTTGKA